MSARVLIVDDVPANAKLLVTQLRAEYFEVVVASSGPEALDICQRGQCDVVLLDVVMPEMDGLEVCRRLKANPATIHLPVIMITALSSAADRVAGLEAGADDFLTRPIREMALTARVRSAARLKMLVDEVRASSPAADSGPFGVGMIDDTGPAKILVVEDRPASVSQLESYLSCNHEVTFETDPAEALAKAREGAFDLVLISLDLKGHDSLRLCSQLRSADPTRMLPILVVDGLDAETRLMRALDLGVNDYLTRPIERNELQARVRTQLLRKRYTDRLRQNTRMMLEMATTDGLTKLSNRRRFEDQLLSLVEQSTRQGLPASMLVIDIDHFKSVNDTYGHLAGDKVLIEFGRRIRRAVRDVDLAARFGGEEFVVALPETDAGAAYQIAERLRTILSADPFRVDQSVDPIEITVSIGVASLLGRSDSPTDLLSRADAALYQAKRHGRNRVASTAA